MSNIMDFESIRSGASTQTSLSLSPEEQQLLLSPTNEHARTAGLANNKYITDPSPKLQTQSEHAVQQR